jgi:hypothetical protein
MEDIRTAMSFQADYVAVSFPKNATDMEMARQLCNVAGEPEFRHKPGLIAKIERSRSHPHLESILKASDGIMVARGDLAVEVGNAAVPALQKRMIRMAREHDKVVITATQMMESMITNPVPTRAEVSDVANAVLDGTDAVMLSAETAAGKYPLETIEEMANICEEAERPRREAGRRLHRQDLQPHRPVHRHGRAVHRAPPGLQGHRGADRFGLHRAVDEPPPHPHPDLRADAPSWPRSARWRCTATCGPLLMDPAPTATRRWPGREAAGGARHRAEARRHLRHHLRRAHGLPRAAPTC